MSPGLSKQLYEKYPKIFAGRSKPITKSLMAFGFECGDGWHRTLCEDHAREFNRESLDEGP